MVAYVIAEIDVTDPEGFAAYREIVPPIVAAFGGRYLARGGAISTLEGDWEPRRLTLLEFPSVEQARAFHDSPEYAEAKALRLRTTNSRLIVVEGLTP